MNSNDEPRSRAGKKSPSPRSRTRRAPRTTGDAEGQGTPETPATPPAEPGEPHGEVDIHGPASFFDPDAPPAPTPPPAPLPAPAPRAPRSGAPAPASKPTPASGRGPERGSGRGPERGSGRGPERGSGRGPERGSGHSPERGSGRGPGRAPARAQAPAPTEEITDAPIGAAPADAALTGAAPEHAAPEGAAPGAQAPHLLPDEIFAHGVTFEQLGLRGSVVRSLTAAGFARPTVIQAMLIPPVLAGKNVLGQARTGTGKTAAFGLPILHLADKTIPFQALILVPTRELAAQVAEEITELSKGTPIRATPVYGGQRMKQQIDALARGPQIVVGTPGRLMDMVERGYLHYRNVRFAVLDEVDRMLDIGFRDDIRRILKACPEQRQTIFVSATLPAEVERLARQYAPNAEKVVAAVQGPLTASVVKQYYLSVQPWDKRRLLLHLLTHEEPALTVVFCRTKRTVDDLADFLRRKGIDAHAIHGDMYQAKRNKVIEKLHKGELGVLVASDLASRGLDVEGISHVVNYDMPEDPEVYVHRIGRTARLGRDGVAWALVTPEQGPLLTQVEQLINAEVPKLDYPDFTPGPVPERALAAAAGTDIKVKQANLYNRYAATVAPAMPRAVDTAKFPGGVVPTKLPPRRMFGRVKTSRSMRESIDATLKDTPPGTTPPTGPAPDA